MSGYFRSLHYNLQSMLRFSGRDTRGTFWPWTLTMVALQMIASLALMVPIMLDMMERMQRYVVEHPDAFREGRAFGQPAGTATLPPELIPNMQGMAGPMQFLTILVIVLLAAAVCRRLHDCDRSGYWGSLPIPFALAGTLFAPTTIQHASRQEMGALAIPMINSLLYWAALIYLIVLTANRGTEGSNRFGLDQSKVDLKI